MRYPKTNKYHAKRTGGFDSQAESDLSNLLLLIQSQGFISGLSRQNCVSLTEADIRTKVDFRVFDEFNRCHVWCEMKGFETERWLIIKKLWRFYGPGPLRVYKKNRKGVYLDEEIFPQGTLQTLKFKW